jgi:magnesium transporter
MLTITQLKKLDSEQWHSDSLDSLPDKISEDSILWVDSQDPSKEELTVLINHFKLNNDLTIEKISEEGRHSKIDEYERYVSFFANFPNREHFLSENKTDWLALFAGKKWIISIHKGYSDVTCQIYKKISTHGYFALSLAPSIDILLYIFLDLVTNECFLVSDMVHEKLQTLSREAATLFRERSNQSNRILGLDLAKSRDQVLTLRQSVSPLREVVGRIARGETAVVSSATLPRFEDLYDRTISLIDSVDTHREEIHDIGDILINVQTFATNNIIRTLTIISAIFLPLTLIAGVYGTNFLVPGEKNIYGFYVMVILMAIIASGLIITFRRKGWL